MTVKEWLASPKTVSAFAAALSHMEVPGGVIKVTPFIEGLPGYGKTTVFSSLAAITTSPVSVYEVDGPSIAKPIQDLATIDEFSYAYAVPIRELALAARDARDGKTAIVLVDEARAVPTQYADRLLRPLFGDKQYERVSFVFLSNPSGYYNNPDPFLSPNFKQRLGHPISMSEMIEEPVMRRMRDMYFRAGYERFVESPRVVPWDAELGEILVSAYETAVKASTDKVGIPDEYRSPRQATVFAAHMMLITAFLRANTGIEHDLTDTSFVREAASMRFTPAGAVAIINAIGDVWFKVSEYLEQPLNTLADWISKPAQRAKALSARRALYAHIRSLSENDANAAKQIDDLIKRADVCAKTQTPLGSAIYQITMESILTSPKLVTIIKSLGYDPKTIAQQIGVKSQSVS